MNKLKFNSPTFEVNHNLSFKIKEIRKHNFTIKIQSLQIVLYFNN
jgi:hypothetical protein